MPADAHSRADSSSADQFEALYLALRRRLLLQCFALTGDLAGARAGVRDAFTAARQQWRRVSALESPEAWIRQRAMNTALRRNLPHRRRSQSGITHQQQAVLTALADLKDVDRKALVLRYLGDLPVAVLARDLALPATAAQTRLDVAETAFARTLGCAPTDIADELRSLAPIVTHPGLPRVHALHERARRRGHLQIITGVVAAIALTLLASLVVRATAQSDALAQITAKPLTRALLLTSEQIKRALPSAQWRETGTTSTTDVDALEPLDSCRRGGVGNKADLYKAWVRRFASDSPGVSLTQRTEISRGDGPAQSAYATTLDWYADCSVIRAHVVSAARLKGVGDDGWLLQVNTLEKKAMTYQVLVARSGLVTSSLVLSTPTRSSKTLASRTELAELGRVMTQNLCPASAVGLCEPVTKAQAVAAVPPTPRSEPAGMLTAVDLPLLPSVKVPWVGTKPVSTGPNLAATQCDATTFKGATTSARSFLMLGVGLPQRFGLTETIATYPTPAAAAKAATKIKNEMATCHKRQIGSLVDQQRSAPATALGPAVTMWHEEAQINAQSAMVTYWMGVIQSGRDVAQVTFIPAGKANTNAATFLTVVQRAAQRLTQR